MSNSNSENPHVGQRFQEMAKRILSEKCHTEFDVEASIPIGEPPKGHKFDLVSKDGSIVAGCLRLRDFRRWNGERDSESVMLF